MIRFLLNDTEIRLTEAGPGDTLLDFLRLGRGLTGTKEGCAEGDCGACTVLVGRLHGDALVYEPVNACIRFLASCHRCHVVTIEHLRGQDGGLHPIQRAMVEHHGSQCGFCTPGFVMALYGLWMAHPDPDAVQVETALQGNLCRCTGYAPIVRAALAAAQAGGQLQDFLTVERDTVREKLSAIPAGAEVSRGDERAILPADSDALALALLDHPKASIVAGATDVGLWVTKQMRAISPAIFIGHLLKGIEVTADEIRIQAGVTYSEFLPVIREHLPQAQDYIQRIGGWQVRNAGTIGGNIANGSPIGEMPPLFIALDARIVLRRGSERREIPLESFFIEYGKQDRRPGEFLETVIVPLQKGARIAAYKVSKRANADISAVACGIVIHEEGGIITRARAAFGGMAGTPKRAAAAEAALTGQPFAEESFDAAARAIRGDFTPLSDWRASAEYRSRVAANLFRRFWLEQAGGHHPVRINRAVGE